MSVLSEMNKVLSDHLKDQLASAAGYRRTAPIDHGSGPRTLLDDDVAAFLDAAESRTTYRPRRPSRSRTQRFMHDLRVMYPTRLRRLEREMRWFRTQAIKHGLDPEEIRGLL